MPTEKLSREGFFETVAVALENLRQDHPEIEWEVDEDDQIVVWNSFSGPREVCHFCKAEVEYRNDDWYNVVTGTTCVDTGGHVVVA